ncbi:MAG TPA: hypothetical protein VK615_14900 [Candidatus Binatia bacterium]|nr:hypothetical protein [Candidatus Binatia bacterium]
MRVRSRRFLAIITLASVSVAVAAGEGVSPSTGRVDTVNYVLGTQTIGIKYKFTEQTGLVETAQRIQEMGSTILKFSMTRRYMQKDLYSLPRNDGIRSLVDLASKEPSVKAVLDMPFAWYHIWVYPFAHEDNAWVDGPSEKERNEEYEEIHALAKYLLQVYSGTGKTFFLGHWEGDWYLHPGYDPNEEPTPTKIQSMIAWLNVRQKAIDDAKRDTKHSDVNLYHYTEVNLVQKGMKGRKCLVNDVLPHTAVDYVSYSCYETINLQVGNVSKPLHAALDYIESKLPPKVGIQGKRVFIGEYGFSLEHTKTPQKQDLYARDVCRAALEWGCPFVLYWEMYCNENPEGKHRGFWLIDDKNRKQPFYDTLSTYYETMKRFVAEFRKKHGRLPTDNELRKKAVEILSAEEGAAAKR